MCFSPPKAFFFGPEAYSLTRVKCGKATGPEIGLGGSKGAPYVGLGFLGFTVEEVRKAYLALRLSPRVRCAARDLAGRAQFKPVEKG